MGTGWLGLEEVDRGRWRFPVRAGVLAGSGSLYGGCATAAVLEAASRLGALPPRWAAVHFVTPADRDADVEVVAKELSQGRTVRHVAVDGAGAGGTQHFSARVAVGDRRSLGEWQVPAPSLPGYRDTAPFDLPSHAGTFADRFEWRLVPATVLERGTAGFWVRSHEAVTAAVAAGVLCDYATYAIGRASNNDVGGMSVDNTVRLHSDLPVEGPLLLVVAVDSLDHGFGSATARVWREDGTLVATGSQTMVLNPWNWRQVSER